MDFLKTLLAYLTLLSALGVQEGPAVDTVPTPTLLPPSVTATVVPHQTAAPTATLAPTPEPKPTITPNYRYDTIEFGDKGTQVRKLQNRLIELGYMPAGSADSQYGYQTYNAVKAFQKANGLTSDGVAGAVTLTHLYESKDVVGVTEPTAVPTASPTPPWEMITPPPATPTPPAVEIPLPVVIATNPPTATPTTAPTATTTNELAVPSDPEEALPSEPTTEPTAEPTATPNAAPAVTAPDAANAPASLGWKKLNGAVIIHGNAGRALYTQRTIDGHAALVKPGLWRTADGRIALQLRELTDAMTDWSFGGSADDGLYTLMACGYEVTIHQMAEGLNVLVDGEPIALGQTDVVFLDGEVYVIADFLTKALGAEVVFDVDENSLLLFTTDKQVANAVD